MILPLSSLLSLGIMAMADPHPVSVMSSGGTPRVLVFTRTLGYRHDSIPTAIEVLRAQAGTYGVSFDFTEDPALFVDDKLKEYDGVMFVSNSEEVLDNDGQAALARYFRSGGTYTGVHAASACLFNDTSYLQAVGAYFDYHPSLQPATFLRTNESHVSTAHLPDEWRFTEEVYYFRSNPRTLGAKVILTVDESSYTNDAGSAHNYPPMGDPHPIAWYIESPQSAEPLESGAPKAGRSFYTSLGHLNETWHNETFIQHVMNGLTWALDGASTRAYGVGLVGNFSNGANQTKADGNASTSGVSGSGATATSSASGTGTGAVNAGSETSGAAQTTPTSSARGAGAGAGVLLAGVLGLAAYALL